MSIDRLFTKAAILLAVGAALVASPALSQGPMAPAPRPPDVRPPTVIAPQAPTPVIPQAPVVTQIPAVTPAPGPNSGSGEKRQSNRDHIDQDAQTDLKRGITTSGGTSGTPIPNNSNTPIPGVDVVVKKQPGGNSIRQTTDGNGRLTFNQLAPGRYDVALPDTLQRHLASGAKVSMTTFVNGTPQARTDFPAGSSVGTFEVTNPRDTVVLGFTTNQTPVNGIGGMGGGRFTYTAPSAGGGTPTNKGAAGLDDANAAIGAVSTTRLGTAPGSGTPTNKGAAGLADANTAMADVSTTRLGTGPGGSTPTNKGAAGLADANTAMGEISTTRLGSAPGGSAPIPNNSNQPIPGIDVVVKKKPAGSAIGQTTDGNGRLTFRQLDPGSYDIALPSTLQRQLASGAKVSMTTFVNGAPQTRTIIPVGSSVGTFEVANTRDTIVLEFKTDLGQTPVNGVGGTGGGR